MVNLVGGRPKDSYSRCVEEGVVYQSRNYGDFKVVKYHNSKSVDIEFVNTGFKTNVQSNAILIGNARDRSIPTHYSVGILDVPRGCYNKVAYKIWCDMLRRCYRTPDRVRGRSYLSCSVSDSFKVFSYFEKWLLSQVGFGCMGYQLDKDLLLKGNKIYSEDTCCLIPKEINQFLLSNNWARGDLPMSVSKHTVNGNYVASLQRFGKRYHLGSFDDPNNAFAVYKEAKESYAKELANKWQEQIESNVYIALMNYKVEITD